MKKSISGPVFVLIIFGTITSCHSGESNARINDTAVKRTSDTVFMPGTPGPSGTQPRPGDTTQAHRDSLKHEAIISDSSQGRSGKQ